MIRLKYLIAAVLALFLSFLGDISAALAVNSETVRDEDIRDRLTRASEEIKTEADRETTGRTDRFAQWYNWGNWANWNNWRNW
ncbi:hypothetical protein [Pukyongiella litopenaei]|uniref:Uncharacterized protein n=1 Tax=Pukyongiella litopenaei TaxID=2605946 RepID=A0A5C2H1H4_9RHOB|nr:hypothetical protein [Pukyongiella litopenaei]QEP30308.1 hypothetical protein C6Y53_18940 [Pukyongiella litopenaei]